MQQQELLIKVHYIACGMHMYLAANCDSLHCIIMNNRCSTVLIEVIIVAACEII